MYVLLSGKPKTEYSRIKSYFFGLVYLLQRYVSEPPFSRDSYHSGLTKIITVFVRTCRGEKSFDTVFFKGLISLRLNLKLIFSRVDSFTDNNSVLHIRNLQKDKSIILIVQA